MATTPTKSKDPDGYNSGDDEDIDSWGIGSVTVSDLAKLLDSPTDERPIILDDDIFV